MAKNNSHQRKCAALFLALVLAAASLSVGQAARFGSTLQAPAPAAAAVTVPAPAVAAAMPAAAAAAAMPAASTAAPAATDADAADADPAAAAPPANAAAAARPKLRLGCIVPLTGNKNNTGRAVKLAIEMAIKDYTARRLPGVDVILKCEDTRCGDTAALWGGQRLARGDHVDAIIGEVCSSASLSALSAANRYKVPLVSPASTSPALSIEGDYFYRTVPSDRYQGHFAARAMRAGGFSNALVVATDDSYGQELALSFIAAFTAADGTAVEYEVPELATLATADAEDVAKRNTSGVVAAARAQNADAVYIATNDVLWAADVIAALRRADPPLKAAIFGGDSVMDPAVAARAGAATVAGVRGSDVAYGSPSFANAFARAAMAAPPPRPTYVAKAAHAYDATWAVLEAYRRAQAPKEGPQILEALASVKFHGKSGPIAFDHYGDLVPGANGSSYAVTEFAPDGTVRVVPRGSGAAAAGAAAAASMAATDLPALAAAPAGGGAAIGAATAAGPVVGAAAPVVGVAASPVVSAAAPAVPTAAVDAAASTVAAVPQPAPVATTQVPSSVVAVQVTAPAPQPMAAAVAPTQTQTVAAAPALFGKSFFLPFLKFWL